MPADPSLTTMREDSERRAFARHATSELELRQHPAWLAGVITTVEELDALEATAAELAVSSSLTPAQAAEAIGVAVRSFELRPPQAVIDVDALNTIVGKPFLGTGGEVLGEVVAVEGMTAQLRVDDPEALAEQTEAGAFRPLSIGYD
jgi:hypothetical protein